MGALSGRAARFPRTARWSAPDITALSWDRNDNLWLVEDGSIFMASASGGKPAPVAEFAGSVTDLSIAPDGVRIAIIVQNDTGGSQLELAAVNPSGIASGPPASGDIGTPSAHPYLSQAVPLGPNITEPTSLTWYDADNLLVLDRSSDGNMLWEVPVDGQQATGPQLTPPGAVSIAANGAANALVAGLSDGRLAVSTGLSVQWQYLINQLGQDPAYP
jgi:hypothetical protein